MFSLLRRKKQFFKPVEIQLITEAVKRAEQRTSGEVRIFVESRCSFVDAIDRAKEIFFSLKMENTGQRNAVLIYLAIKDRQVAVYGDEGIHTKVGEEYWRNTVNLMINCFRQGSYAQGLEQSITQIGEALNTHFPYDGETDKNELPDDIVFGK